MKIAISIISILFILYIGGCNHKNVDDIKENAESTWKASGFNVVGYEGFQIGQPYFSPGGQVWYLVKKEGSDIIFSGMISKRMGEYHIYNLKSIDAISP